MKEKVSVVIPTHNRCNLLKRAIESVRNQTYPNLEIIVISDASTDETDGFVQKIRESDDRITYIRMDKPGGGNVARNKGIDTAIGEYIAFLDDDDEWLPEKIELQMKVFEKNSNVGLVYTGINIIYVNEKVSYSSRANESGDLSKKILIENYIGTTSSVVVKKEILVKAGKFDVRLKALQDYDLWIRCCQLCDVQKVDKALVNYYNYTGNAQVSSQTSKYEEAIRLINQKYTKEIASLNENELIEKRICENKLLINKALRNNNRGLARKYIKDIEPYYGKQKSFLYYVLSLFNYKTILKIRSKVIN